MSIKVVGYDDRGTQDGPYSKERHYRDMLTGRLSRYADEVLRDNPRAWWRFNDVLGSTSIADSSGNGRNLSTVGTVLFQSDSPTSATGATMYGVSINGGSTADGTYFVPGNGNFTLSGWIRTTQTGEQYLYRQTDSLSQTLGLLLLNGIPVFEIFSGGGFAIFGTSVLNDGKWHYLVATRESGVGRLYVDGVLEVSATNSGTSTNFTALMLGAVGYIRQNNSTPMSGSISDISLFYSALSAARIQAHYNARVFRTVPTNALDAEIAADTPYAWLKGSSGIAGELDAANGQGIQFPSSITGGQSGGALGRNQLFMNGTETPLTPFASTVARGKNTWTVECWVNPSTTAAGLTTGGATGLTSGQRAFMLGFPSDNATLSPGASPTLDTGYNFSVGTNGVNVGRSHDNTAQLVLAWAGTISGLTQVVIRCVAQVVEIWVNGTMVAQAASADSQRDVYAPYGFLSRNGVNTPGTNFGTYNGFLGNIALYNYALGADRIRVHAQAGLAIPVGRVTSGLLGEYGFNEGSGQSVSDSSGNGRTLQLGSTAGADSDDPVWVSGGGLNLSGDKQLISSHAFYAGNPDITIVAVTSVPGNDGAAHRLYSQGVNTTNNWFFFGTESNGLFGAGHFANDQSFLSPSSNAQSMLVYTYDSVTRSARVFQNGASRGDNTFSSNPDIQAGTPRIGRQVVSGSLTEFWNQTIHYLAFYTRVLTPAELLQMQNYLKALMATRGITLP